MLYVPPFQVGVVSVALCAPAVEGSYTSHWRLAHAGEQFGPRVWCSIVVDPLAPAPMMADGILVSPCVTPQVGQMSGCMKTVNLYQLDGNYVNELKYTQRHISVHLNVISHFSLQGKNPVAKDGKACAASREQPLMSVDQEEYYIPSVDLLTAQVTHNTQSLLCCRLILQLMFSFTDK